MPGMHRSPQSRPDVCGLTTQVRRALSPSTSAGEEALRGALLASDNTLRWDRVNELIEQQQLAAPAGEQQAVEAEGAAEGASAAAAAEGPVGGAATPPATADPLDAVRVLLGSPPVDATTCRQLPPKPPTSPTSLHLDKPHGHRAPATPPPPLSKPFGVGSPGRASASRRQWLLAAVLTLPPPSCRRLAGRGDAAPHRPQP